MAKSKYFPDINIDMVEDTETYIKVTAQPFERGYGVTVGNSLRRILMTAIPGAGITSVRFDEASHEFTTIPGVVEDLSDIVLNLKEVRFKMDDQAPVNVIVKVSGPGSVTAADIGKASSGFEVLNPEQHIATITSDKEFTMELRIMRGKGYISARANKREDSPLGTIYMDTIFNPVTNAIWDVKPIPTSIEGYEQLVMEVTTDGSTTPKDAVNHAASLLRKQLAYFLFTDANSVLAVNEEEINEALEIRSTLKRSIDDMELSVRSHNCLQAAGIRSIGELVSKEEAQMLRFRNFGRKSLTELNEKLGKLNLYFGMDVSKYLGDED
jgi:DNA-directed RNA polymerase subunit alpha